MVETPEIYRTFLGIDIGTEAKSYLGELQSRLKSFPGRVTWPDPGGIHLTLSFLGQTSPAQLETLAPAIKKLCTRIDPFTLTFRETGVFPHANRPRILWVGLEDESRTLLNLKRGIDQILSQAGFDIDRRHFTPHITVGRVKFLKPASELIHSLLAIEPLSVEWEVRAVNWYSSILTPSGAEYSVLKRFELKTGGSA